MEIGDCVEAYGRKGTVLNRIEYPSGSRYVQVRIWRGDAGQPVVYWYPVERVRRYAMMEIARRRLAAQEAERLWERHRRPKQAFYPKWEELPQRVRNAWIDAVLNPDC